MQRLMLPPQAVLLVNTLDKCQCDCLRSATHAATLFEWDCVANLQQASIIGQTNFHTRQVAFTFRRWPMSEGEAALKRRSEEEAKGGS
mmetsp:Transcript_23109/g.41254  ORF Transcript_23109/g.41254 Transcript_23109/m.41254 type:complete len:88 (-) Transcript_23109:55-318(-)